MKEKNTKNLVTLPFEHAHRTRSGNDNLFSYIHNWKEIYAVTTMYVKY